MQKAFAKKVVQVLKRDRNIVGLAVAGSWLTSQIDKWSDLDLVIVTKEDLNDNGSRMVEYANHFGNLLSAFTGEHVGEKRLLICLYDAPLLHVDIKFVTLEEFCVRIEDPIILLDTDNILQKVIDTTKAQFPVPDFQWIEDRFWTWVHYGLTKIGRGEYIEALDFMAYLRMAVFGPLLHIKNNNLPRGVRKVETSLQQADFKSLESTLSLNSKESLLNALNNAVLLYKNLRRELFNEKISYNKAENPVLKYMEDLRNS